MGKTGHPPQERFSLSSLPKFEQNASAFLDDDDDDGYDDAMNDTMYVPSLNGRFFSAFLFLCKT
jgi:hypothetical protein